MNSWNDFWDGWLKALVILSLLVLNGCKSGRRADYRWEFVTDEGPVTAGVCSLHSTAAPAKPWFGTVSNATGALKVYFPSGYVYQERQYVSGLLDGHFKVWFPNGILSQDVEYTNGIKNGRMLMWHENGKKAVEARYEGGRLTGEYKEWFPEGSPKRVARYTDGATDGHAMSWDEKGRIVEDGVWRMMRPWSGRLILYKKTGEQPVIGLYKDGVLVEEVKRVR